MRRALPLVVALAERDARGVADARRVALPAGARFPAGRMPEARAAVGAFPEDGPPASRPEAGGGAGS